MRSNRTALAILALFLLAAPALLAQPSLRPAVQAVDDPAFRAARTLNLPALDRPLLALEDAEREARGEPYRFAMPQAVFFSPHTDGDWESLPGGLLRWRLRVTAVEAESLNFGFTRFRLPAGARLTIYAADGSQALQPFTSEDNRPHGELWTPVLLATDAVVEVTLPEAERGALELVLGAINQGYRGFRSGGPDKSGSCNVDVICPEGDAYRDIIRSVARITISGAFLCSGSLVNNTAQNLRPLFLTADHCDVSTANDQTVVTYWLFENTVCRPPGSAASGGNGDGSTSRTVSGSTLIARYAPSDFSLIELSSTPPSATHRPFWAGWDRTGGAPGSAIGIHHPQGDEKRISFENQATSVTSYLGSGSPGDGTHLRVADWDLGTTEGGSSGSPLFNSSKRVVGQLHGGFAACGNNSADWYGRLNTSWTGGGTSSSRLSDHLDPAGTGATSLGGTQSSGGGGGPTPAAPSNLTATTQSTTMVLLGWQDNADNESDFRVELAVGNGAFAEIGTVPANSIGVQVTGLTPGTSYRFRVRARNGNGNSAYSNVATATTQAQLQPPTAPDQPSAETVGAGSARIKWRDRSNNEAGFDVEARLIGQVVNGQLTFVNGNFTTVASVGSNVTETLITSLAISNLYNFRVRARNGAGSSAPTMQVAAATETLGSPGACVEGGSSLCLLGDRFQVNAFWHVAAGGTMGTATAVPSSDLTGFFWFFDAANIELVVKVLDGTPLTGSYWTFYGALSDVEYWVVVTDTQTGNRRAYYNPQGNVCGVGDTASLPGSAPPPELASAGLGQLSGATATATALATKGGCVADGDTLCLLGGRFAVEVDWRVPTGNTGVGTAVPGTGDQSGYFWFFDAANLELVVKVIDARALNGRFWVFYGALSDVEYHLTVTDTQDGELVTYNNAQGNLCGGADTDALDD
ncbi:MAG TPA: fibronectin type III domain-containing protein [Thermoanaerobaculia bacterium]|nr:fibronectin type III domain-containing protein [Thermoanaerobaculia bacterium]